MPVQDDVPKTVFQFSARPANSVGAKRNHEIQSNSSALVAGTERRRLRQGTKGDSKSPCRGSRRQSANYLLPSHRPGTVLREGTAKHGRGY
jgi:hypothetical protein